jgi:hypothetical protein
MDQQPESRVRHWGPEKERAFASADLLTVFGVGVGLGATVRPRPDEEFVLVFCAKTKITQASSTEAATRNLFMLLAP